MGNATKNHTWPPVESYTTGYNYGRYLRGFSQRFGLIPLNEVEAVDHAERMADPYIGNDAVDFVRGFLHGYGLEDREAPANKS